MAEALVTVTHPVGLHARPAAVFYRKAREFQSQLFIHNTARPDSSELPVSPMYLIQAAVKQGHTIRIRAEGDDAEAAVAALVRLVEDNFGETV